MSIPGNPFRFADDVRGLGAMHGEARVAADVTGGAFWYNR